MKAIILAAGIGQRLYPLTKDRPKCLLTLGKTTILQHQLELLSHAGFRDDEVAIMTGYKDELIRHTVAGRYAFIQNARYESTNNLVTLSLARDWVAGDDIVIINSDALFGPAILGRLLAFDAGNAVVVDNFKALGEEEMKVQIRDGMLKGFGKHFSPDSSQGEYIGIAKFCGAGVELLFDTLDAFVRDGRVDDWYEAAFDRCAKVSPIYPVYTDGLPWIEMDTLADYERAQELYLQNLKEATI